MTRHRRNGFLTLLGLCLGVAAVCSLTVYIAARLLGPTATAVIAAVLIVALAIYIAWLTTTRRPLAPEPTATDAYAKHLQSAVIVVLAMWLHDRDPSRSDAGWIEDAFDAVDKERGRR